jgi:hypothetical protein
MSWYQSMAGAEIAVRARDARRIGLSGVDAEDVGVLHHAGEIGALLKLGQVVGAVDDRQIDALVAAPHGSTEQVAVANRLGSAVLSALAEQVEGRVGAAMAKVQPTPSEGYQEFLKWAERDGWEFPVEQRAVEEEWHGLSMLDGMGLTVVPVTVASVPGKIGGVAAAFVAWLCGEALKSTSLDLLEYRLELMGLPYSMFKDDEIKRIAGMEGEALTTWANNLDVYEEDHMEWWVEQQGGLEPFAWSMREFVVKRHEWTKKLARVRQGAQTRSEELAQISKQAKRCPPSPFREMVLKACAVLEGPCTRDYLEIAERGSDFERLPGEVSVVDIGLDIGWEDCVYQDHHEGVMQGEDAAFLPLNMPHEAMLALLTRITLCERLLLLSAAMLEAPQACWSSR